MNANDPQRAAIVTAWDLQDYIENENARLEREQQFWAKEIVVKIEYKFCPNLTIIDTPGQQHSCLYHLWQSELETFAYSTKYHCAQWVGVHTVRTCNDCILAPGGHTIKTSFQYSLSNCMFYFTRQNTNICIGVNLGYNATS